MSYPQRGGNGRPGYSNPGIGMGSRQPQPSSSQAGASGGWPNNGNASGSVSGPGMGAEWRNDVGAGPSNGKRQGQGDVERGERGSWQARASDSGRNQTPESSSHPEGFLSQRRTRRPSPNYGPDSLSNRENSPRINQTPHPPPHLNLHIINQHGPPHHAQQQNRQSIQGQMPNSSNHSNMYPPPPHLGPSSSSSSSIQSQQLSDVAQKEAEYQLALEAYSRRTQRSLLSSSESGSGLPGLHAHAPPPPPPNLPIPSPSFPPGQGQRLDSGVGFGGQGHGPRQGPAYGRQAAGYLPPLASASSSETWQKRKERDERESRGSERDRDWDRDRDEDRRGGNGGAVGGSYGTGKNMDDGMGEHWLEERRLGRGDAAGEGSRSINIAQRNPRGMEEPQSQSISHNQQHREQPPLRVWGAVSSTGKHGRDHHDPEIRQGNPHQDQNHSRRASPPRNNNSTRDRDRDRDMSPPRKRSRRSPPPQSQSHPHFQRSESPASPSRMGVGMGENMQHQHRQQPSAFHPPGPQNQPPDRYDRYSDSSKVRQDRSPSPLSRHANKSSGNTREVPPNSVYGPGSAARPGNGTDRHIRHSDSPRNEKINRRRSPSPATGPPPPSDRYSRYTPNGPSHAQSGGGGGRPCPACGKDHDLSRCRVTCFDCGRKGHKSSACPERLESKNRQGSAVGVSQSQSMGDVTGGRDRNVGRRRDGADSGQQQPQRRDEEFARLHGAGPRGGTDRRDRDRDLTRSGGGQAAAVEMGTANAIPLGKRNGLKMDAVKGGIENDSERGRGRGRSMSSTRTRSRSISTRSSRSSRSRSSFRRIQSPGANGRHGRSASPRRNRARANGFDRSRSRSRSKSAGGRLRRSRSSTPDALAALARRRSSAMSVPQAGRIRTPSPAEEREPYPTLLQSGSPKRDFRPINSGKPQLSPPKPTPATTFQLTSPPSFVPPPREHLSDHRDVQKLAALRETLGQAKKQFQSIFSGTENYLQNAFKVMLKINPTLTMDTTDFLQQTFGRGARASEIQAIRILQGQQMIISAQEEQERQLAAQIALDHKSKAPDLMPPGSVPVKISAERIQPKEEEISRLDGIKRGWKSIAGDIPAPISAVAATTPDYTPPAPPSPMTSSGQSLRYTPLDAGTPSLVVPLIPRTTRQRSKSRSRTGNNGEGLSRMASVTSVPKSPTKRDALSPQSRDLGDLMDVDIDEIDDRPASPPRRAGPGEVYEKLVQVGEGTYGKVYKARSEESGVFVALKRIRMEGEKDGFPVTAMREIKLLQGLDHPNVVKLHEIMVSKGSVYMVSEYMHHDLTGVLSQSQFNFSAANLKSLCHQMLSGLGYLHDKSILHRDMKGSNILINNRGELKLADFGLARLYNKRREMDYTNRVITLWYRSPELLMGETVYGPCVDMWSAGCIMLELFVRKPVFQGNDEIHQLDVIYALLGTPDEEAWPGLVTLPWYELVKPRTMITSKFEETFASQLSPGALSLALGLLTYPPSLRLTAEAALSSPYFTEELPPARRPSHISRVEGEWHEMEAKIDRAKKRRQEAEGVAANATGGGSGGMSGSRTGGAGSG